MLQTQRVAITRAIVTAMSEWVTTIGMEVLTLHGILPTIVDLVGMLTFRLLVAMGSYIALQQIEHDWLCLS